MPSSYTAEYYFEYEINRISGNENIKDPKIYFERDYRSVNLPYTMFAVPDEWLNKQDEFNEYVGGDSETRNNLIKGLPYDKIDVVFDIKGIDCSPLTDKNSDEYKKAEIKLNGASAQTFDSFYRNGCRLNIESNNSDDHSGVGVMEMFKNDDSVAKFFFAVNFTFRKNISYELEVSGKTVNIEFECKDSPVGIKVNLVYGRNYIPCLKNNMRINVVRRELELDFSKGKCKRTIHVDGEAANQENVFSLAFENSEMEKYYVLECLKNTSLKNQNDKKFEFKVSYSCPYCHRKINYNVVKNKGYKRGGASCQSGGSSDDGALPVIYTRQDSKVKKYLYCLEDLIDSDTSGFQDSRRRLLPPAFMSHDNFKIAFTGSSRAGKTTYLSRFFDIFGDEKIGMSMNMAEYSLKQFGINISTAYIPEVTRSSRGYQMTDTDWTKNQDQYQARSIDLLAGKYPVKTPSGDYTAYPFTAEVNRKSYVSFYDIAGEDSMTSLLIKNIANGDLIGLFLLINGKTDKEGNKKVIDNLKKASKHDKDKQDDIAIDRECPLAVIVTKMDTLEQEFDSNCQCLRSDYFDSGNIYEGSEIERIINISSEEIKSYLSQKGLLPDFEGRYNNVKYFGVSSFNFMESIHDAGENTDNPGQVKFDCSSKRIELPFLWMLKQFGVIK